MMINKNRNKSVNSSSFISCSYLFLYFCLVSLLLSSSGSSLSSSVLSLSLCLAKLMLIMSVLQKSDCTPSLCSPGSVYLLYSIKYTQERSLCNVCIVYSSSGPFDLLHSDFWIEKICVIHGHF